jgi:hypothetical protein
MTRIDADLRSSRFFQSGQVIAPAGAHRTVTIQIANPATGHYCVIRFRSRRLHRGVRGLPAADASKPDADGHQLREHARSSGAISASDAGPIVTSLTQAITSLNSGKPQRTAKRSPDK